MVKPLVAIGRFTAVSETNTYNVGESVGGGSYCRVYLAVYNTIPAVVKIYIHDTGFEREKFALTRITAYQRQHGLSLCPELFDVGIAKDRANTLNFLLVARLGPTLSAVTQKIVQFTEHTVLKIALRSLENLRGIHQVMMVIKDVKADNYCFTELYADRLFEVMCCDYSLSAAYEAEDFIGAPDVPQLETYVTKRVSGTFQFSPRASHFEIGSQLPYDDMESWFYMIYHLAREPRYLEDKGFHTVNDKYHFWSPDHLHINLLDEMFVFMKKIRRNQLFPYDEMIKIINDKINSLSYKDPTNLPYAIHHDRYFPNTMKSFGRNLTMCLRR
ncbi:unnamed protein product [Bursaphelenchus okinawaensis]|uniref:Protein kinase domain-containing protein n=1 Tax=Bursaphelenchus okinawaensis TaxID=465554 RepID=A0A811L8C4_9BILA|nr:unnamed protein product [Bursaphelenchus okinawaensis]CAG9118789.1 unnamed protein product [Bursaphelenchus okinawaensis]